MDIAITDCYIKLAGQILNQAQLDVNRYRKQRNSKNANGSLKITKKEYNETIKFLNSEYADYLKKMILDWKFIVDHLYTPKEMVLK